MSRQDGAVRIQRLAIALACVGFALSALGPAPISAVVYEFPPGYLGFHTYQEMANELAATAAAHPGIVKRFSIGKSYGGRQLWAAKISDRVATDEDEPEVLFDGLHHGNEHMSQEMTLAILRWLVTGYGTNAQVTSLVNNREIWIVFGLNPDGATYDVANRTWHHWRKNRQPTPGSSSIGTDLNRNYDYRWGCCGGASSNPASSRYRGPSAFSAPETRALRDFAKSRIVGGRQQIRTAISFHTTGRLILYPYGYTYRDVPADMDATDHRTFVAMAKVMAATNGYKPEQASDLYISSGTSRDWLYGRYRVFSFTFELSPNTAAYPSDESIATETERNRKAVMYAIDLADCPYRAIGKSPRTCRVFVSARP
jgi:carboxypeptidase T